MTLCNSDCQKCSSECFGDKCRCYEQECRCKNECVGDCPCRLKRRAKAKERLTENSQPLPTTIMTGSPDSCGNFCCSCDNHACCECCSDHQTSLADEKLRIKGILLDEILIQHSNGTSTGLHAKQVLLALVKKLKL